MSKEPVYARLAIPEDIRIERLARLLHDAGRSAPIGQNADDGVMPNAPIYKPAFVEWDDAPERTRAGRRSQAAYLLAAGVVLPGAENLKNDPKLADDAKANLDIAAKLVSDELIRREKRTSQPLQSFPTDEEIRAWRWWERLPTEYPRTAKQIVELYFDSDGQLLARDRVAGIAQTTLPPVVLRYGDPLLTGKDLESVSFNFYRADQWRKAPAPTNTQIAPTAADREAAAK